MVPVYTGKNTILTSPFDKLSRDDRLFITIGPGVRNLNGDTAGDIEEAPNSLQL